jgi:RNA chaperone Hfq
MTPKTLSEQLYLDELVSSQVTCHLYLISGVKLTGVIQAHSGSGETLWLQPQSNQDDLQMLYMHAISTICPVANRRSHRAAQELDGVLADSGTASR